jgi:hypothetical protein
VLVSQPFSATVSQLENPVMHRRIAHRPFAQSGNAFGSVHGAARQPPQCWVSDEVSISQPFLDSPSQFSYLPRHVPTMHSPAGLQIGLA